MVAREQIRAWSTRAAAGLRSATATRPPFGQWSRSDLPSFVKLTPGQDAVLRGYERYGPDSARIAALTGMERAQVTDNFKKLRRMGLKIRTDAP